LYFLDLSKAKEKRAQDGFAIHAIHPPPERGGFPRKKVKWNG